MKILGVDTGGTFTDFVLWREGQLFTHKVLSTPHAPEVAILQGVRDLGVDFDDLAVVHGSTVATNAVLERKGVRTVYIANTGLSDVLRIGRQARKSLYQLQPSAVNSPVAHELCLECGGRIGAHGELVEDMSDEQLQHLSNEIIRLKPAAVAINLLFAFLDPRFEMRVKEHIKDLAFVCCSSEVLPEYREYERGIATWLNAYTGPLMQGYLQRLAAGLTSASLSVMSSSGGTIDASYAGRMAVQLLLSGPAGGLRGARYMGLQSGETRLLTFDMGGTSTDVALIDGDIRLTNEGRIGDFPVAVPMVDMHTIGAGGGSIAWLDEGGMLQVGPESAGANPGPACYGQGGQHVTVTDANLILGRLHADAFLGGAMSLDIQAAIQAAQRLAQAANMTVETLCEGILRIANEHMAQALRVISVQRGEDPRQYVLTCFGGAGGLHICEIAQLMGIKRGMVPSNGGVLSALGMLVSPRAREYSHTINQNARNLDLAVLEKEFERLESTGKEALVAEGLEAIQLDCQRLVDMRYRGQSYTLTVSWEGLEDTLALFHATHEQRFGHKLEETVELLNIRTHIKGPEPEIIFPTPSNKKWAEIDDYSSVYGVNNTVPVYRRDHLAVGQVIDGPAIIVEKIATAWIAPLWQCCVDKAGNLMLQYLEKPRGVPKTSI
ncbi:MAG: hydantoinase/oxoprolinase family protein [Gammaproteobacteria bacterium]|nr:hydantoinase/oxoprolinase family protein [Gammaproteobacteria bacterium]